MPDPSNAPVRDEAASNSSRKFTWRKNRAVNREESMGDVAVRSAPEHTVGFVIHHPWPFPLASVPEAINTGAPLLPALLPTSVKQARLVCLASGQHRLDPRRGLLWTEM